jgi:hypothetical protein
VLAGHDAGVFRQRRVARELGLTAAAFHAPRSNS